MATKTIFTDKNGNRMELESTHEGILIHVGESSILIEDSDLPEFKAELKAREKQIETLQENTERRQEKFEDGTINK